MAQGGPASYRGYEYQINVTVWLALDLIIRRKLCDTIIIEPASLEDVSAGLQVESQTATATVRCPLATPVQIQIKSRDTGHWSGADFRNVISPAPATTENDTKTKGKKHKKKGPPKRPTAVERLRANKDEIYCLITDAQQHAELRNFRVTEVGKRSSADRLPTTATVDADLATRITILPQQAEAFVLQNARDILRNELHVPEPMHEKCIAELREAVRRRLLKKADSELARDEILGIVRRNEGYPSMPRAIVLPTNYVSIRDQLTSFHAVFICGPPGTGKTFVEEHLIYQCRTAENPFTVVRHDEAGRKIRDILKEPENHVFVFDDPFGSYAVADDAQWWINELPKLLADAAPNKKFIIVSRTSVAQQIRVGKIPEALNAIKVVLSDDNYTEQKRREILKIYAQALPQERREWIEAKEEFIIQRIHAPFSLENLIKNVGRLAECNDSTLEIAIKQSNIDTISTELTREIVARGKDSIASGILLWFRLMITRVISTDDVRHLRRTLQNHSSLKDLDPEKLFDWLKDSHRLVQTEHGFSAHPLVLEGLEKLFGAEPGLGERVAQELLNALVNANELPFALSVLKKVASRNQPVPPAAMVGVDQHLATRLIQSDGPEFREAFLAVDYICAKTPETKLAKILQTKASGGALQGFNSWSDPQLAPEDLNCIRNSPNTHGCAQKFIRNVLMEEIGHAYSESLIPFFRQFGWDLSDEFLVAAERALETGNLSVDIKLLVKGALSGANDNVERVLASSLKALDEAELLLDRHSEDYGKAEQAEFDAAYCSHVAEQPSELYFAPTEALETIVRHRRKKEGFQWILDHESRAQLFRPWAKSVDEETSSHEIRAILSASKDTDLDVALDAIRRSQKTDFFPDLLSLLGSVPERILQGCVSVLADCCDDKKWQDEAVPAISALSTERRIKTAIGMLGGNMRHRNQDKYEAAIRKIVSPDELTAVTALGDENRDQSTAVNNPAVVAIFREIAHGAFEDLAAQSVELLAAAQLITADDLEKHVKSEKWEIRLTCLRAAGLLKTVESRQLLRRALNDEDYRCRRAAMHFIAGDADAEEKQLILHKCADPSAPIREFCATLVGKQEWAESQDVLVSLLRDRRDNSENAFFHGHMQSFHVARAAADSLAQMKWNAKTIDEVINFIQHRDAEKDDHLVHYRLIEALGFQDDLRIPKVLERMLDDRWLMPGEKNSFPIRYAAAWALVFQLWNSEAVRKAVDHKKLLEFANHPDPRLAVPCLIALGLATSNASDVINIEGADKEDRLLILLLAMRARTKSLPVQLFAETRHHPAKPLLECPFANLKLEADWDAFLNNHVALSEWLDVKAGKLQQYIHLLIGMLRDSDCGSIYRKIRKRELNKGIPVRTLRSMFGGE